MEFNLSMEQRIQREKEHQNKNITEGIRAPCSKFYAITRSSIKFYEGLIRLNCRDKQVLDYGCGSGTYTCYLAKHCAIATGIDISDAAIERAKQRALKENLSSNTAFSVMNAENLKFNNDSFDVVCGGAVLHHLDLNKALSEISRVLKPDGKAFFVEPLGHNLFINLYRYLTPNLRSSDEHPLRNKDLRLIQCYFREIDIRYFHLTSLLTIPFRNLAAFSFLLERAEIIDKRLFKLAFFKKRAWQVVIILSKPQIGCG